jgi:hypothetical protein
METLAYAHHAETRPAWPPDVPVSRVRLFVALCAFAGLLTLPSLWVVVEGATDEPYGRFSYYDALVQVVVGTGLITAWGCWSLVILALVVRRKVSFWWLTLLLWAAVCAFYLSFSPLGYLDDLQSIILPAAGSGG